MESADMFRYNQDEDDGHLDTDGSGFEPAGAAEDGEDEMQALRSQLEQKDKDLMLAAELGKALLEKNSDLEKKLEQSTEDYNQRIEVSFYIPDSRLYCLITRQFVRLFA